MKVKLSEIADVQTGYIKRNSKKPAEPITVSMIQLRNIKVNGAIEYENLKPEEINTKDRYPKLFPGDVIFAAKGSKRSAGVINRELIDTTASNHYLIIRIRNGFTGRILPEYLAFYLRQKPAMEYFELCAAGSHIPFVSAGALKELEIIVLDKAKQTQLVELERLMTKERQLSDKLNKMKDGYHKQVLAGMIMGGRNDS